MNQDSAPQAVPSVRTGHDLERLVLKGLLLFFLAVSAYIPAMSGGYIYDDDTLLTQNPQITRGSGFLDGESWKGLATIWFPAGDKSVNDYAPLSSTTLWVEWRLWGNDGAGGYHATNIVLHAAGALLLWAVLAQMSVPGAWVAALLWGVHPVGVESVAWIAERRNVLSMPMLMLTLLTWLRFQRTRTARSYTLAVALFAATLLAKATVVMLPVFLLLWIWWRRNRVTITDLRETAPFFLLSVMSGVVTMYFQYVRAIADEKMPIGGLLHRIASAGAGLGFYFYKAVLPFNLIFNYPEWHKTVWPPWQALPWLGFAAVFYWAWRERGTWGRHVILGLGFFVIMIAPALGVMKMAYMRITLVADHFQYMPMAGLIALAVAGGVWLRDRWKTPLTTFAAYAAAAGVSVLFFTQTWQRADVFREPESLWKDTLAKNPDAWQAHEHLGAILMERHDLKEALVHFRRGAELRPLLGETHNNYGNALRNLGMNPDEALQENKTAVELTGSNIPIRVSYADALVLANRPEEAIVQYQAALNIYAANPAVCNNLGVLMLRIGKTEEAIDYFRKALKYAPEFQPAQAGLESALQQEEKERGR